MAVLSAELTHSHYWWTFSFTDHNSIDPVTARAGNPCWGISAWTVTPRQSWGHMRQIPFTVWLLVQCLLLKGTISLEWAQGKEMKIQDMHMSMAWLQILEHVQQAQFSDNRWCAGLHSFLPHLLDLIVAEIKGNSEGLLVLFPSQSTGSRVTGSFFTKSYFTLAIGRDQPPSKQRVLSIFGT